MLPQIKPLDFREFRVSDQPTEPKVRAADLRAQAAHVRWIMRSFPEDESVQRLAELADELEAKAKQLEDGT